MLSNSEVLMNMILELKKELETANRVESKYIQKKIQDLEYEKNQATKEL
jgi:hypothetical protein